MDPFGAVVLPLQCGIEWIALTWFAAGRSLYQPDGLAVGHVNRREQLEDGRFGEGTHSLPLFLRSVPAQPDS